MNLKLLASAAILAFTAPFLTSCGSTGHVDVNNPTVAQLDALDVQWGLPKRTMRGGPRRFDSVPSASYSPSAPAPAAASAPSPAAPSAPAAAPSSPATTVDPNVIKSLR